MSKLILVLPKRVALQVPAGVPDPDAGVGRQGTIGVLASTVGEDVGAERGRPQAGKVEGGRGTGRRPSQLIHHLARKARGGSRSRETHEE